MDNELILNTKIRDMGGRMYIGVPIMKSVLANPQYELGANVSVYLAEDNTHLCDGMIREQKPTMWWVPLPPDVVRDWELEKDTQVLVYLAEEDE